MTLKQLLNSERHNMQIFWVIPIIKHKKKKKMTLEQLLNSERHNMQIFQVIPSIKQQNDT